MKIVSFNLPPALQISAKLMQVTTFYFKLLKILVKKIEETTLATYFIKVTSCPSFMWSRIHWTSLTILTLFRMGLFASTHGWGGDKKVPITKISHTYPTNMKLWHSYTLPKENPKNIWIMWHSAWLLLTQHFLIGN